MKVIVVFEFEGLPAEGEQTDQIVEAIGESCEVMGAGFDASGCWIEDVEWD